jgi:hypothetical protein
MPDPVAVALTTAVEDVMDDTVGFDTVRFPPPPEPPPSSGSSLPPQAVSAVAMPQPRSNPKNSLERIFMIFS